MMLLGSGHDVVVNRLADAVSEVSAGNRDATAAIYTTRLAIIIQRWQVESVYLIPCQESLLQMKLSNAFKDQVVL